MCVACVVLLTHAYYSAALVQRGALLALHDVCALLHRGGQLGVEGVCEAHMAHEALLEEGEGADALGAVDDLVGHDKVHWPDVLLQRPDGAEGDDGPHTDVSQGGDVGLVGDLMGRKLVVGAVAGQERDGHAVMLEDADWRGCVAPGGLGVDGRNRRVALDLAEAGAAYDGDVDRVCTRGGGRSATQAL